MKLDFGELCEVIDRVGAWFVLIMQARMTQTSAQPNLQEWSQELIESARVSAGQDEE